MKDPKVFLVTGGLGFAGSNFILSVLKSQSLEISLVINIDKCSYASGILNTNDPRYLLLQRDLCDSSLDLVHIIETYKVTHIIHFAASTSVDISFLNPIQFLQDNVFATQILLESIRKCSHKIEKFIYMGTDEVYGETPVAVDESHSFSPTNPYAASKAAAESILMAYSKCYSMPAIISIRCNNIFGPRQYPDKIIPNFIMSIVKGKSISIHGDGLNRRRYVFVEDVIAGILIIIDKGKNGDIFNMGSDYEFSNIEIAHLVSENINQQVEIVYINDRLYNDRIYRTDCTKLKKLGWECKRPFHECLKKTIEWYIKDNQKTIWSDK
jgi:dTDP-glucose 4,6-dehydratase